MNEYVASVGGFCAKLALREIFECAARIRRNESVRHRRHVYFLLTLQLLL